MTCRITEQHQPLIGHERDWLATGSARAAAWSDRDRDAHPGSTGSLGAKGSSNGSPSQDRAARWSPWAGPISSLLRECIRSRGLARAVPASLALATASLILTALVHTPSPVQQQATRLLEYQGDDLYSGELWRLVSSGLLAQSWLQYLWTLFIAVVIFAVLEVQIGWARLLACVAASHVLPTVTVALLAPLLGHADVLSEVDYGTSCLVVGAVAGLAWLRRSLPLAAIVAVGVIGDVMLSAPLTVVEHTLALVVGVRCRRCHCESGGRRSSSAVAQRAPEPGWSIRRPRD